MIDIDIYVVCRFCCNRVSTPQEDQFVYGYHGIQTILRIEHHYQDNIR